MNCPCLSHIYSIASSEDPELRKLMHQSIEDDPQLDPPIPFDVGTMSFAGKFLAFLAKSKYCLVRVQWAKKRHSIQRAASSIAFSLILIHLLQIFYR